MKKVTFYREYGFTLLELMVAVTIAGILSAMALPAYIRHQDDKAAQRATEELQAVMVQAREHRLSTGSWPANVAALVAVNRIPAANVNTIWGTPYVFQPIAPNNLRISIDTTDVRFANKIGGSDLPFVQVTGTTVSSEIVPAGEEASTAALYRLDGTRPLTGDMNANGNSINGVNQINATGNITTSANIQGRQVTATDRVNAQNGIYVNGGTYYINGSGDTNIRDLAARNLTVNDVRAQYLESNTDIRAARDIFGRHGMYSGNLSAGGSISAAGNINGLNITASNQITGRDIIATTSITTPSLLTNVIRATRFEDRNNASFYLEPAGVSNIADLNAANGRFSYLRVTGNIDADGNVVVGQNTRTNTLDAITSVQAPIYYGTNPSFYIVPDGISRVNGIQANQVTAANMYADAFIARNDPSYAVRPSGNSTMNSLSVNDMTFGTVQTPGGACPAGGVALDNTGNIMSCRSGNWEISGGGDFSKVLIGSISNGQKIPIPLGYNINQCRISISGSTNYHGAKPNYFAGNDASYNASTRIVRCGFWDDWDFHARGICYYTVSCNKTPIASTTGPVTGETVTQSTPVNQGSTYIDPIAPYPIGACNISASRGNINFLVEGNRWRATCLTVQNSPSPACGATVTCTVP